LREESGWWSLPAAFFLLINFSVSTVKVLFVERLIYFLFLITLFFFLRRFNINKILKITVGGIAFIIFIYGILQKFVLFPLYLEKLTDTALEQGVYSQAMIARIQSGRIFSIFRLPTLYAIICAVFILFIFHYFLKAKSLKSRISWAFLLVPGLFNLVLTQSFGGLIYISAGALTYLLLAGVLKLKYLAPILMVLCLFLSLTIALRYPEARKMEPIKLRLSNWNQAARAINSSPFPGVGLGNYESTVSYFTRGPEAKSIYAHNFFLQFIAETGIIIPLFLVLLLLFARKKLKPHNPREGEKALYISVFFILLTYNLIDIGFYFFPAGLAGAVVLSQIYPAHKAPQENKRKFPLTFKLNLVILVFLSVLLGARALSDSYRMEADMLQDQREYAEAGPCYKKSLVFNPWNFKALTGCASVKFHRKDLEGAEKYLDQVLNLYPDSAPAHYLKAQLELVRGRLAGAFFHARQAHRKSRVNAEYRNLYRALENSLQKHLEQEKQ
jgi:tetratricopeptide (TPR) repeat protein